MKKSEFVKNKKVRSTAGMIGVVVLIMFARAMYHSPSSTAEPGPLTASSSLSEPVQGVDQEMTETSNMQPSDNDMAIAEPDSLQKESAQKTIDVLLRYWQARAYQMSRLPQDELNEQCWVYRPAVQELQDRHEGGDRIDPSEFTGEDTLIGDMLCQMALHYQKTGDAPNFASVDISKLEGVPDEWKNQ